MRGRQSVYVLKNASATIKDVELTNMKLPAIAVGTGAHAVIRSIKVHDTPSGGILVTNGGRANVEGGEFSNCATPAIYLEQHGSQCSIVGACIRDCEGNGIYALDGASTTIEDVDFTNMRFPAIAIATGADAVIRNWKVHNTPSGGVLVMSGGKANIQRGVFVGCAGPAIHIEESGSQCRVLGGHIVDCGGNGVSVINGANLNVEEMEFTKLKFPAVAVGSKATATIQRCNVYDTPSGAMLVQNGGKASIEGGEFRGCTAQAICVEGSGSNCSIKDVVIRDCENAGIEIVTDASALFDHVKLTNVKLSAMVVKGGATAMVRGCTVMRNRTNAVLVRSGAKVDIEGGDFSGCPYPAISVADSRSHCRIDSALIRDCASNGIYVWESAGATIENAELTGIRLDAIAVGTSADVVIRNCKIRNTQGAGVTIQDGGRASVEKGVLSGLKHPAIVVRGFGTKGHITGSYIYDCEDAGISIRENASAVITDVELTSIRLASMTVRTGAEVIIRGCKVHDCAGPAFSIQGATTRIEGGEIWAVADPAIDYGAEEALTVISLCARDSLGETTQINRSSTKKVAALPEAKSGTISGSELPKPIIGMPLPYQTYQPCFRPSPPSRARPAHPARLAPHDFFG